MRYRPLRRGVTRGSRPRPRPGAIGQLLLYAGAAGTYVALSVFFPVLLFSWIVGTGYLLLCVWILPALVRRLMP